MIINTLWIGREMGALHAACLRSFIRHGHDVVLHAYGKPVDAPKGVVFFDADKLMSEKEIFAHKSTGSLAIASDIYRYRIQREGLGIYVDCDVYCVKPFQDQEYILARESDKLINPAIMKLPHDCALLNNIMRCSEDVFFIPPWLPLKKQRKRRIQKFLGVGRHISEQEWGVIGPVLLTHYVEEMGLECLVSAADVYSPMHFDMSHLLFEVGVSVSDLITSRTVGLHLYNAGLKGRKMIKDSPLYEIIQKK